MPAPTAIDGLDHASLTHAVRCALGRPTAQVDRWQSELLGNSFGASTGGIYRLMGDAMDDDQFISWQLALKIKRPPVSPLGGAVAADEPSGPHYWKRETLAYQSGLLKRLPPGLLAPRCHEVEERPDGTVWLWLEYLEDAVPRWPLARYALIAHSLGRFNGAYLTGWPLPTDPWLSRGWLHGWLAQWRDARDEGLMRDVAVWRHPWVRQAFLEPRGERVLRLWQDHDVLIAALDRLPRTLCHRDANRTNLFCRRGVDGQDEVVAVDWEFTGDGAIGEEIVQLVISTVFRGEVAPDEAAALQQLVWEGYLDGLRAAGWAGDARLARLGYAASAAARWSILPVFVLAVAAEGTNHPLVQRLGRPAAEVSASFGVAAALVLELADEARALLPLVC